MEAVALVVSVLSLAVAGVGSWLANRRASEAIAESRKAAESALWSGIQEAVQRLIGFDPSMEPIGERLQNLRIAGIALVDEMPEWAGLDKWLEAERALGAVLGRQVMELARPTDTVDQRLKNLDPYLVWAQVLGGNLRRFRAVGYDAAAAAELRASAESRAEQIYVKHGWERPPKTTPGVKPVRGTGSDAT
ncbi:MAG: hypothetical protein WA892_00485 [Ornithinimicrobium sp.]